KRQPFAQIARDWREKLDRVRIDIGGAPELARTIRTSLAYTLIHRDGAALKPGSRSYDRAWIRDGALLGAMLLRLGHAAEAKAFHSCWDDFLAIKGLPDADFESGARCAPLPAAIPVGAHSVRPLECDLLASMNKVIEQHHLDYVPASVELADFDPTSTAIG